MRDESLLSKCLRGKTQNVNEGLNGVIWTKCPKRVYVNRKTLEICVSSAVLEFNEGKNGIEYVTMKVGLNIGELQSIAYCKIDSTRKRQMVRKLSTPCKQRRKDIRSIRKRWGGKNKGKGGKTYEAGGF